MIDKSLSTRNKKIKAFTVTERFLLQANNPIVLTQLSSPFLPLSQVFIFSKARTRETTVAVIF